MIQRAAAVAGWIVAAVVVVIGWSVLLDLVYRPFLYPFH
jgi:hypothetical protein